MANTITKKLGSNPVIIVTFPNGHPNSASGQGLPPVGGVVSVDGVKQVTYVD